MREIERGARFFNCFSLDSLLLIIADKARARGEDLKRCCERQGAEAGWTVTKKILMFLKFVFLFSFFLSFGRDDKMGELGLGRCFAVICARSASARRGRLYEGEWPLSRTMRKTSHFVY